ncbi:hypothetical protein CFR78_11995 [Komagataeibacter rhaeticus]|nr:hypothetical protein CT154_06285 [Komagataeibacter xylinus]KDU96921.1 hypothetical protein GLUCORHAEAF1_18330 [Komagataeibacter rhaeticus AF1]PYD52905.1 hypothetical protein CFR78_11995 [Komagataeibacter rhaeticus]GBQ11587.1 hypothetical protein AA16663_0911 [Komagataeibacter rhaeticus DSM 16663]SAY48839.1 hypothetical protein KRIGEM_01792 [Komagataeibacter rhaeticus]
MVEDCGVLQASPLPALNTYGGACGTTVWRVASFVTEMFPKGKAARNIDAVADDALNRFRLDTGFMPATGCKEKNWSWM